jgi:hypothetical protein
MSRVSRLRASRMSSRRSGEHAPCPFSQEQLAEPIPCHIDVNQRDLRPHTLDISEPVPPSRGCGRDFGSYALCLDDALRAGCDNACEFETGAPEQSPVFSLVRSRPPVMTSMARSMNLLKQVAVSG